MFDLKYPIIQAPMAGGITTPELVAAVSNAGALGSLGAAYLTPSEIEQAVARVRALTSRPFNVNLFAIDFEALAVDSTPALAFIAPFHEELGLPPPRLPQKPAEDFQAQMRAVLEAEVPIFSFTMGVPSRDLIAAFKARGTKVVGTATTVREAVVLSEAGVDAVTAQGSEAGAHRGTFLGSFEEAMISTLALVPQIRRAVSVPVIAAGGIMNGAGIRAVLTLGASAAMLGTAFLVCPEAGTAACYKAAVLAASGETAVTRAFSGRPARGIRNRFMVAAESTPGAVLPFPWQNAATKPLRAAAAKAGRADLLSLWAGQGAPLARAMPAAELVRTLVKEAGLDQK